MTDHRDIVLRDPELDPANKDYEAEISRKVQALKQAIEVGLVTKEEGLSRLEKWVAHV
jgi:cell division protein FtsX